MQKLKFVITAVLGMWAIQACSGNNKGDSKERADSANIAQVDSVITDTTLKTARAANDSTSKMNLVEKVDVDFVTEAASGGLTEVALGKIAEERGINKRVKNFGKMMITDHTKANNQLIVLAKSKNISLPTAPDADGQEKIDELTKKSVAAFDEAYVNYILDSHKKDIKTFQEAAKNCADPDIKLFAYKTLRVLQKHLDAVTTIHDSMK